VKKFLVLTAVLATALATTAATANAQSISKRKAERMAEKVTLVFAQKLAEEPNVASVDGYASGQCSRTRPRPSWRCYYLVRLTRADGLQIDCFGPIDVRFRRGTNRLVGIRRPAECTPTEN
jgi:hypothetical protein